MISSCFDSINFFEYPRVNPFNNMFSLAVNSISKPAPSSINGEIDPFTVTVPSVGLNIPEIIFNVVLFPLPLSPMRPNTSPFFTLKLTFFNAIKESICNFLFIFLIKNSFTLSVLSLSRLNCIVTFFISIAFESTYCSSSHFISIKSSSSVSF